MDDLLDVQRLLTTATERFGAEASLEPVFVPALTALSRALQQEARLSVAGTRRVAEEIVGTLGERAGLRALEAREPSVVGRAVRGGIVITGLPRTGTTLLHNLLGRVEGLWAPPLWQLRAPVRPPEKDSQAWDLEQHERAAAMLERLYTTAPDYRHIHPMDPDWPDQCNLLLRKSFSTLANAFTHFVPSYVHFLATAYDMRPAYADHRRWLRALLHRREQTHGDVPRLALKDPFHMWHLEALLDVYPDATIIQLHREPTEVVASLASMCETLQAVDADSRRQPGEIGRFCLFLLGLGLQALERARTALPATRFVDLSYRELIASPGAVLAKLGGRLGFDARGVAVEEAGEWLERNRQHGRSRHAYSLDGYGLTAADLDAEGEHFVAYRRRFGPLLD